MVPLFSGPVPLEILKSENPIKFMTEKVKAKHPNFRALEGISRAGLHSLLRLQMLRVRELQRAHFGASNLCK